MIKFDSKSRELSLLYRYDIDTIDGKKPTSVHGKVDVSDLTESERQLIIAVSKLVHQFSTGHNVAVRESSTKDDKVKALSPIESLQLAIDRYVKRNEPSQATPDETQRENVVPVTDGTSSLLDGSYAERLAGFVPPADGAK